jgi:hypothetical protein
MIYLVEMDAYDPALPGVVTLRYSSGLGYAHPTAPGFYDPRVVDPATLRRDAFGNGTTTGAVEVGVGELVLGNRDGALDGLLEYGLDGRLFRVLIGEADGAYSSFTVAFSGTMEQPTFGLDTINVRLRDRLYLLEVPAQPNSYAGNNALPAGLDGVDDLRGRPKPLVFGLVRNIAPPVVNTSALIYQVNDGAIASAVVYDNGVLLTAGADYTSQADMETNAPAGGQVRVWPGGGYFRLGSPPAGQITADVTQGATAADRTAAQILRTLATGPGGLAAGDVSSADVTALDTANGAVVGLYLDAETTVRRAMEQVSDSVGAWFGFDRLGILRMRRLEAPSGTPAIVLRRLDQASVADATTVDMIDLERVATNDEGRGVPAFAVRLGYQRVWVPQTDGLAGAVTAARREVLRQPLRYVTSTDATVQTQHLLARELEYETLLDDAAAAQTESDRRLTLRSVRRDRLRVRVRLDEALASAVDLGATVQVVLPRYGYSAGRLFAVIGIETQAARRLAILDLWG